MKPTIGGYAQGTETIRPSHSLNGEAGGAQLGRGDPVEAKDFAIGL